MRAFIFLPQIILEICFLPASGIEFIKQAVCRIFNIICFFAFLYDEIRNRINLSLTQLPFNLRANLGIFKDYTGYAE